MTLDLRFSDFVLFICLLNMFVAVQFKKIINYFLRFSRSLVHSLLSFYSARYKQIFQ